MLLIFLTLSNRKYVPLVALLIATSLSASIIVLYFSGMSLNLLTLAGLLLSVGLGLDYAIVYFDRLDRLSGHPEAAAQAIGEVAGPLLGALLTTLAAILPFLFVQGLIALLFHPLIWTVLICALFSFVFALILLPTFTHGAAPQAPNTADPDSPPQPPLWWRRVQYPGSVLSITAVLAVVLVIGARGLPFEVLPVVDDGFVDVRITHPVGIPTHEMDQIARQVEQALMDLEGTDSLSTTVGGYFREGLPAFRPGTANYLVRVDTRTGVSSNAWAEQARQTIEALDIDSLSISVNPPRIRGVQTRLTDADIIVVLTREDGNLLTLNEVENDILAQLQDIEGLSGVRRLRAGVSPRWVATPNPDALARYGVDSGRLRQTLAYALEGQALRERMYQGEPLVLRARFDRRLAGGPQQLDALPLSTSEGILHLGSLVDFDLVEEPTHIERREGQRVVRIAGDLDPDGPGPGQVADSVRAAIGQLDFDEQTSWWLEGEVDALEETRQTFMIAMALAILMVLTLLVMQYGRVSVALAGLIAVPLSGAGAVLLLHLMSRPLDAMVLAGILIAIGIVANNVILMLSHTMNRINRYGWSPVNASYDAARARLRPVTLTVLSTVIGISPLLLGGAEVFGLLQPLAIALTGTLLFSIPVACLVLPGLLGLILRPAKTQ